jgi:hypothetical protein
VLLLGPTQTDRKKFRGGVRYDLSPMSQAAHVRTAVDVAHNLQVLPVGAAYVAWTDVGAIRLIVL